MSPKPSLLLLVCLFIMGAAWLAALSGGRAEVALVSATIISLLCAALLLLRLPDTAGSGGEETSRQPPADTESEELAEFRRGVFELCAALKLGIRFCEQHLHSEPDALLAELERMRENISTFVNRVARPVRFYARRRWPWNATVRRRPQR